MDKSLQRTLPSVRPKTECVIPDWLRDYAHAWCEAGALAVVLYGSRAFGTALPDSDWDVAVVLDEGDDTAYTEPIIDSEITHHYEVNRVIGDCSRFAPGFAREIRKGVSLVGDIATVFPKPNLMEVKLMNKKDFRSNLMWSLVHATDSLYHINSRYKRAKDEADLNLISSSEGTKRSANATERCVKALCCLLDIGYEHTHNVEILAEKLPDEWRELAMRMNGNTQKGHVLIYEDIEYTLEDCQTAIDRVVYTLDMLELLMQDPRMPLTEEERDRMCDLALNAGSVEDVMKRLGEADSYPVCFDQAQRIADMLDPSGALAVEVGFDTPNQRGEDSGG